MLLPIASAYNDMIEWDMGSVENNTKLYVLRQLLFKLC